MTPESPKSGLDERLVKKLAQLAKLALDDAEVRALVPELSGIVRHVDALRAVDTTGVPPMIHGAPLASPPASASSSSSSSSSATTGVLGRAAVAGSAGYDADDGTVKVPRVID
jgi:Asp-tRNA(Asn)/Glu-tRNA(Gln) amidotransferase C subunit